ncbi:amidohydrolase [Poronia punctata]|nr:amidohydrolase [Poronia punctata]
MRSALFTVLALAGCADVARSASVLLSGGTIIAFDDYTNSLDVIRHGSLLITDDRIVGLYKESRPREIPADTEIVDCTHKIISPGFIDTHRHGWQTALKTLGSNTSLADYMYTFSGPASAPFYTPEDTYTSQLTGLLEAINAGVTTTLDHAHNLWSTEQAEAGLDASIESGARVFWAPSLSPFPGYPVSAQIKDWKRWNSKKTFPNGLTILSLAYDDWITGKPEDTQAVIKLIKEENPPVLTVHWLGGIWIEPTETGSPSLLNSHNVLDLPDTAIVFSHGAGITAGDASLLRKTNQFLSITPESEMHCGHGHTNSHLIHDQAALGVDVHFAFSTDILTQARLWLQRTRSRLYDDLMESTWAIPASNPMSVNQAFLLATRQGALALRRPDLGVIKVGAKADLVVFDGRSPGMLGWADPVAAVILHANVGDIEHVLVDGKFVKRDGKLTYPKYDELVDKFLASAERLRGEMLKRPQPVLEGGLLIFEGGAGYGHPRQVDVVRGEGTGYGPLFR